MKRLLIYNALLAVIYFLQEFVRNYAVLEAGRAFRLGAFAFLFLGSYVISALCLWALHRAEALVFGLAWALGWSFGAFLLSPAILQFIFPGPIL